MNKLKLLAGGLLALALISSFQNCGPGFSSNDSLSSESIQFQGYPTNAGGISPNPSPVPVVAQISFSPSIATAGSLIKVIGTGTNFNDIQSASIGSVNALVISKTATGATLFVMPGTPSGSQVALSTSSAIAVSTDRLTIVPQNQVKNTQGTNIVGSIPTSYFGEEVAVSADGGTFAALDFRQGTILVHIFVRLGTTWTLQGDPPRMVCAIPCRKPNLAFSADGNTLLVGGTYVLERSGAIWRSGGIIGSGQISKGAISADGNTVANDQLGFRVFVRANGAWIQQGPVIVPMDAVATNTNNCNAPYRWRSTFLSADGNTVMFGDSADDFCRGAVWFFRRSNNAWSQMSPKLAGSVNNSYFGIGIALSADGSTAAVAENGTRRHIFVRSGTIWLPQGAPIDTGALGRNVSLSADGSFMFTSSLANWPLGNQAGGLPNPNEQYAWRYGRAAGVWMQLDFIRKAIVQPLGQPRGGGNENGVAISADGTTLLLGSTVDYSLMGSAWIFSL